MNKFFQEPVVRLFLRALLAGGIAFASKYIDASGHLTYTAAGLRAAIVGGGLAFCEVFTPLNQLVGVFKTMGGVAPPAPPVEPPA